MARSVSTQVRRTTTSPTAARVLREVRTALDVVDLVPEHRALADVGLVTELADVLYAAWWVARPTPRATGPGSPASRPGVLEAARRSVVGTSERLVLAVTDAHVVTVPLRGGAPVLVDVDEVVRTSRPGSTPAPGDLAHVLDGASHYEPDGWWWVHSSCRGEPPAAPVDRWYLHAAGLEHAAALLRVLLPELTAAQVPFSLKAGPAEDRYDRADAVVVYAPRAETGALRDVLRRAAPLVAAHLRPVTPPTTDRVLPGVATAQDPGGGRSFGQVRCEQVARVAVARDPQRAWDDAALAAALGEVGVDVDHPGVTR
ncbi:MAG: hypothetical protein IR158_10275 [Cellulomonas sp.]|uniref:T3SS effector HopA1 family protein n=1 Tax=Cellulomonas sp. TaxID=40001 RepID=UPI001A010E96|nr:T3SS effector HopA1 family protein [Cellulomonas sp.]MBF0688130.1 hypothetical protein [Cellulomonas sp.]